MKKLRDHIDDICIKDKFMRNDTLYTVEAFHGSSFVLAEGPSETDDTYISRNETLLNEINEYHRNKSMEVQLKEDILPNDYPVHGNYLYVCDGKVIRCDLMSGTVADLKRDLRSHYKLEAKEIRRCDIAGRQEQLKNEKP